MLKGLSRYSAQRRSDTDEMADASGKPISRNNVLRRQVSFAKTRSPGRRLILRSLRGRIAHAGRARRRAPIPCAGLQWTPSGRPRKPGAPSAVGGVQAHRHASLSPRSPVWTLLATAWRNWRTALIVVHPDTVVRWHRPWLRRRWRRRSTRTPRAGPIRMQPFGRSSPRWAQRTLVGRLSDPCGIEQVVHRRLGADRLAAPDVHGLTGLLHGADSDGTRALRTRAAVPSPSAHRPSQDHRTSHCRLDESFARRVGRLSYERSESAPSYFPVKK